MKTIVLIFFLIAFVIYIPIGLPLFEYEYNEETGLYDYSQHRAINHMRTATQLLSVLGLLLFNASFTLDLLDAERAMDPKWI